MGANTMVAAIGLVLGPVLGGALVAISWQWVFWFNVPLALVGAAWGAVVLRELARPDAVRGFDLAGTATFVARPDGARARCLAWRPLRLERPDRDRRLRVLRRASALWVLIELAAVRRCSTWTIFRDRLFAAASVATFISGLVRFALMFIFVFYFQGAQGDSPITAGIKLAPLAIGMLIASPIAGRYSDRHGSRGLAAIGMLVIAAGLALMTTLQVSSSFALSATTLAIVGVGSGIFSSPNTAAMMGAVPPHRRGVAAGARMVLNNTGSVLSIAFVLAIVTAAIPQKTLFRDLLRAGPWTERRQARAVHPQHARGVVGVGHRLILGALVSLMRPRHSPAS